MEALSTVLLDPHKYQRLLGETLSVVIRTAHEYRRLLRAAEALTEKSARRSVKKKGRLLELLGVLIEEYADRTHPLPKTRPHRMLADLLEDKNMNRATCGECFRRAEYRKS